MNLFDQLLMDLSSAMHIPLRAEQGPFCKIHLGQSIRVQLEYDERKHTLFGVSFLPQAPSGLFAENLYLEALKSNYDTPLIFAYSDHTQSLALQLALSLPTPIDTLQSLLATIQEQALLWKNAIEQNSLSSIQRAVPSKAPSPWTLMK